MFIDAIILIVERSALRTPEEVVAMSSRNAGRLFALLALPLMAWACSDQPEPLALESTVETPRAAAAADPILNLTDLVTVDVGGTSLEFWPYTGRTPNIGDAADPINLVLAGGADPRILRARLMFLGGDRSAFGLPNVFPFNCTWSDAIGGTQAVFASQFGWAGSAVQLQCGDYDPTRFHVRFFRFGEVTVVGSHFDLLVTGTTDHEVVSWELAEQIALVDFLRLGGVPGATGVITEAPTYRQMRGPVFDALPPEFKGLLLATGSIDAEGKLFNDGVAQTVVLPAVELEKGAAQIARQQVDIAFDQVIPRPFCDGSGTDFLYVNGPVTLTQQVVYVPGKNFQSHYHAKGKLDVVQINPANGQPLSEPYRAHVNQHGKSVLTDEVSMVNDIQLQMEIRPGGGERGTLMLNMKIGPRGAGDVSGSMSCKP